MRGMEVTRPFGCAQGRDGFEWLSGQFSGSAIASTPSTHSWVQETRWITTTHGRWSLRVVLRTSSCRLRSPTDRCSIDQHPDEYRLDRPLTPPVQKSSIRFTPARRTLALVCYNQTREQTMSVLTCAFLGTVLGAIVGWAYVVISGKRRPAAKR